MYNVTDVTGLVHPANEGVGRFYRQMNIPRAEIEQAIVNTVSYVDAFDYPLTSSEIHRYLIQLPLKGDKVNDILERSELVPHRLVRSGEYYMLPGRENVIQIRQERLAVSERLWPEAIRYGQLISRMPFVRMAAITGSLAVNNVGSNEDIDFLIVAADDHLWICRAFVILIVRLAAQKGLELCPNYFLSERALHISTHNLYTAHEVAQMVPLFGMPVYYALRRLNPWVCFYLPNARGAPSLTERIQRKFRRTPPSIARRMVETAFGNRLGRGLDQWEMSRKVRKFRQTYPGWQEAEFSADCCKGHFNRHQQRAIQAYERLVNDRDEVELPAEKSALRATI